MSQRDPDGGMGTFVANPPTSVDGARLKSRLQWLDALRAVAVLLVVYEHVSLHVLSVLRAHTHQWFDAGRTGVFLFFIISGYIVPASLERGGDVRAFWINRVFRLYPMVAVGMAAAALLAATGVAPLAPPAPARTLWAAAIASSTLLQDLLNLASMPAVLWSLSYEMTFYLLLSALFGWGLHRLSSTNALAFALAAVLVGGLVPLVTLSSFGLTPLRSAVIVVILAVVGVAGLVSKVRAFVHSGAVLVGALVLGLFLTTERFPGWHALSIPAIMFAGTVLYRADRGQLGRTRATAVFLAVLGAVSAAVWWALPDARWSTLTATNPWVGSVLLAGTLFLVGRSLQTRHFPAILTGIGLISYSVYVLHYILVLWLGPTMAAAGAGSWARQSFLAVGFVATVLGLSALSYRYVELPAQRAGRHLIRGSARQRAATGATVEVTAAATETWSATPAEPAQAGPALETGAASGPR